MRVENHVKIISLAEILYEEISTLNNLDGVERDDLNKLEKIFKNNIKLIKQIKKLIREEYKRMKDMQNFYDEFENLMSRIGSKFVDLGIGAGCELLIKKNMLTNKMKKVLKELGINNEGDILIEIGLSTADDNSPFIQIMDLETNDFWSISIPHLELKKTKVYKLNRRKFQNYEFYPEYLWNLYYYEANKSNYEEFKKKKRILYELFNELKKTFYKRNYFKYYKEEKK